MVSRASAGIATLHIKMVQCLICRTVFLFVFVYTCTESKFFLNFFHNLSFKIEIKKQHGWIFRGTGRDEKYLLKWVIYTCMCTWP